MAGIQTANTTTPTNLPDTDHGTQGETESMHMYIHSGTFGIIATAIPTQKQLMYVLTGL